MSHSLLCVSFSLRPKSPGVLTTSLQNLRIGIFFFIIFVLFSRLEELELRENPKLLFSGSEYRANFRLPPIFLL